MKHFLAVLFLVHLIFVEKALFAQATDNFSIAAEMPSEGFVINNEYSGDLAKGYTLPGIYASPQMALKWTKLTFSTGMHLRRFAGDAKLLHAIPLFRMQLKPAKQFSINFGTLENSNLHRLSDILYHRERRINHHVEEGLQLRWEAEHTWNDLWLHWEHFIRKNDTVQERFIVGLSNEIDLSENFRLHLKALAAHRGGQISKDTSHIQTLFNSRLGISYNWNPNTALGFNLKASWYSFLDASPNPELVYQGGNLWEAGLAIEFRGFTGGTEFGSGRRFISARGNPLWQSVAAREQYGPYPKRQILHTFLNYSKTFQSFITFSMGVALYNHLVIESLDYRYWFSLKIKPKLVLAD